MMLFSNSAMAGEPYKNFKVAVYSRSYETAKIGDLNYIEPIWEEITRQVHVDKIYLEIHRDLLIVDEISAKAQANDCKISTQSGAKTSFVRGIAALKIGQKHLS